MNLVNIHNCSKTLACKKFKHFLNKYQPKFVKTFKKHPNKFDIGQFLLLLYDCVPNMKNFWSIGRLLKNFNVLQVGIDKNPTIPLYCETKKSGNFFVLKKCKNNKTSTYF